MNRVFLTSGPRGGGKSTYVKKFLARNRNFIHISRDEMLVSLFGTTSLSPYEGGHEHVSEQIWKKLKKILSKNIPKGQNIILDYWNGFPGERQRMIEKLREDGAEEVHCLFFQIPKETCLKWFFKKKDSKGYSKNGIEHDYELFYEQAENIGEDGFDKVIRICPLQLEFPFRW